MVVDGEDGVEFALRQGVGLGFAGQVASEAANGIFDAAFLPGRARVAAVGFEVEVMLDLAVAGELGAVVEGDGSSQSVG
jgi:hypothetical protein